MRFVMWVDPGLKLFASWKKEENCTKYTGSFPSWFIDLSFFLKKVVQFFQLSSISLFHKLREVIVWRLHCITSLWSIHGIIALALLPRPLSSCMQDLASSPLSLDLALVSCQAKIMRSSLQLWLRKVVTKDLTPDRWSGTSAWPYGLCGRVVNRVFPERQFHCTA